MRNILKWFVYLTTAVMAVGIIFLINAGELDFYSLWGAIAFAVASYLLHSEKV